MNAGTANTILVRINKNMLKLKPFRQTPGLCGPASLKMVFDYYGVSVSEAEIAEIAGASREKGTSIEGLVRAAKHFGFRVLLKEGATLDDLKHFVKRKIPVIVGWFFEDEGHYSVVVDINDKTLILRDPSLKKGVRKMPVERFLRVWFDFPGKLIETPKDLILRLMLVITPP